MCRAASRKSKGKRRRDGALRLHRERSGRARSHRPGISWASIALVQRALPVLADHGEPFSSWSELVRIAHQRFSEWTGGSAPLWQEGQGILGPNGAAIAFGIALQKHALGETDRPAAYFAGIVEKARTGRRGDFNASSRAWADHVHAPIDVEDGGLSRTRGYPPLPATGQQRCPRPPN